MEKRVFIKTFGCQMNEYDSDKISEILDHVKGIKRTELPEEADIILFNTCSVREKAQEKVFSDLGRVKHHKLKNPEVLHTLQTLKYLRVSEMITKIKNMMK